jgi:hypothetical protein
MTDRWFLACSDFLCTILYGSENRARWVHLGLKKSIACCIKICIVYNTLLQVFLNVYTLNRRAVTPRLKMNEMNCKSKSWIKRDCLDSYPIHCSCWWVDCFCCWTIYTPVIAYRTLMSSVWGVVTCSCFVLKHCFLFSATNGTLALGWRQPEILETILEMIRKTNLTNFIELNITSVLYDAATQNL